jgi:hypothetical protein
MCHFISHILTVLALVPVVVSWVVPQICCAATAHTVYAALLHLHCRFGVFLYKNVLGRPHCGMRGPYRKVARTCDSTLCPARLAAAAAICWVNGSTFAWLCSECTMRNMSHGSALAVLPLFGHCLAQPATASGAAAVEILPE